MDTITRVRTQLADRKGEWPEICKATGLSYWWLTKFAQGRIKEPGLTKIERLQRHLNARAAEADGCSRGPLTTRRAA